MHGWVGEPPQPLIYSDIFFSYTGGGRGVELVTLGVVGSCFNANAYSAVRSARRSAGQPKVAPSR